MRMDQMAGPGVKTARGSVCALGAHNLTKRIGLYSPAKRRKDIPQPYARIAYRSEVQSPRVARPKGAGAGLLPVAVPEVVCVQVTCTQTASGAGHIFRHNSVIGDSYVISNRPQATTAEHTAWSYDNRGNDEPFEDSWSESWENKVSADLSVTSSRTIKLDQTITIANVASTGFSMSMSLEKSETQHKESIHTLSHRWEFKVKPHEKLTLIRVITHSTAVTDYGQAFGLAAGSKVGTDGKRWEGHYYYGMCLNNICNNPKGTVRLQGIGTSTSYEFKLVRESAKGTSLDQPPAESYAISHTSEPASSTGNAAVAGRQPPATGAYCHRTITAVDFDAISTC
ncbi:putative cytolysin, partial [Auricularia subglabra TFB-10046 SS5]